MNILSYLYIFALVLSFVRFNCFNEYLILLNGSLIYQIIRLSSNLSVMENFLRPESFSLLHGGGAVQEYPTNHKILAPSNMHQFAETSSSSTGYRDDVQVPEVSDSESSVIGSNYQQTAGLTRVDEDDRSYGIISRRFKSGLGSFGVSTQVTAIHKDTCSGFVKQAKLQSFLLFSKAVQKKCGGTPNVKYAWFGASRDEINNIISHGFAYSANSGVYANALCLSPDNYPLDCLQSAIPDEDGTRHILLCRVILGKSEVVYPGSGQWHPSSEEFDTGVDNLLSPRKYIVWSTHMNTYVFPEFMVSFKVIPHVKESQRNGVTTQNNPNSPWISFPSLISALSNFLPPHTVKLIKKYYSDHKGRKMTRRELIQHVRELAGDELLAAIIKSCKNKHDKKSDSADGRGCACQKSA